MASKYTFRGVADMSQHDNAIKKSASEIYKYQRQVLNAEKELQRFQKQSKTTAGSIDVLNQSIKQGNFKGALVGIDGLLNNLTSKLGIQVSTNGKLLSSLTSLKGGYLALGAAVAYASKEIYDYNKGREQQDQITQVTTGLKGDESFKMTDSVKALVSTYNVDFREAINAANTLMAQFGTTGDEAIQLLKDGMQGMILGDGAKMLSMIQQYAPAFRDAGINASQLVAIIHNTEGGIFTDENMNAIVTGIKNIRLMTDKTDEALKAVGIDGEKMSKQLADGSITIFEALQQVVTQISKSKVESKATGEVMQQVFGKQAVTAGHNLNEAIMTLNTNLDETKKQTGGVGESFAELNTATENLNQAIRDCFSIDGVTAFSNEIKTNLINSLVTVLNIIGQIRHHLFDEIDEEASNNAVDILSKKFKNLSEPDKPQGFTPTAVTNTIKSIKHKPSNKGGGKSEIQYAVNSVGWLENEISKLEKEIKLQVDSDKIDEIQKKIQTLKEQLELLTKPQTIDLKELSPISVLSPSEPLKNIMPTDTQLFSYEAHYDNIKGKIDNIMNAYNIGIIGADKAKEFVDGFNQELEAIGLKPIQVDIETNAEKEMNNIANSVGMIGDAFSDLGNAMQVPELDIMGTIAQGIANVVMAYTTAMKSPANTAGGIFTWAPAALTGLATMTSIIAAIRNASAYAEGGIINGRTSIGDFNIARVNNGEMILNQRQQSHLFNLLDDNRPTSNVTVNGEWKLKGQDLYMSMKNYGKGQQKLGKNIGIK